MTRPANRPRTYEEVKAAQDPAETARLTAGETLSDAQGTITLFADRRGNGDWRVEWFDDDGGCYVTIFAGEAAEGRARAYFAALKSGALQVMRARPRTWAGESIRLTTSDFILLLCGWRPYSTRTMNPGSRRVVTARAWVRRHCCRACG
jgi:hypothetical protein